jgi:hypothetical protein
VEKDVGRLNVALGLDGEKIGVARAGTDEVEVLVD